MKSVAIIGCSHSCYLQNDLVWPVIMAKKNPHIDVHCYAMSGHGTLWFDQILKHFVTEDLFFDDIIIQITGSNRWLTPINRLGTQDWFKQTEIHNNFTQWSIGIPRQICNKHGSDDHYSIKSNNPLYINHEGLFDSVDNTQEAIPALNLAHFVHKNFFNTYQTIYKSVTNKFHTFKFAGNQNDFGVDITSGMPDSIYNMFMRDFGKEKFVELYLDDSNHLNATGNQIAYDYIKQSNIGTALDLQ